MKKTFVILHPYALDKNFFNAIDEEMARLESHQWGCIMDLDTMPLRHDFGFQLQAYIDKYPDTGMFTSYASRCHYMPQIRRGTNTENPNILYHKLQADKAHNELYLQVKELERRIAGHLMMIKKSTWDLIRAEVKLATSLKKILGVDTQISYAILRHGKKIRLMRGVYLFHYLRFDKGYNYIAHLK